MRRRPGSWALEEGEVCVLDTTIVQTDAKGYSATLSRNNIKAAARAKKKKYLQVCLENRRSFMPLVYSLDGMAGKEAKAFEKGLAALLAEKWNRLYSEM